MGSRSTPLWLLVLFATIAGTFALRVNAQEKETELIRHLLDPERYDKRVRPPGKNVTAGYGEVVKGDHVPVQVNTFVRSFGPIDEKNKDFMISLTFRQAWNDRRLQFSAQDGLQYIALSSNEDIWSPDLFFSNEREAHFHELLKPNTFVRISPNGDILYSTRITLKLSCPLDFTNFPMDKHTCSIRMASYGYTTKDVIFSWKDEDPVQFVTNLDAKPFEIQGFKNDYCNAKTITGEYSCCQIHFLLRRLVHNYILQLYLPLGLLVIASWAPLWLDFHGEDGSAVLGVIGRCLVALMCFLSTITEAGHVMASAPPSSGDCSAIDTWATWCQIFVALVLLEVVIVAVIGRCWRKNNHKTDATKGISSIPMTPGGAEVNEAKNTTKANLFKKWLMGWPTAGQRIDVVCRIIFPIIFIIFNIIYWPTYAENLDMESFSSLKKIPY